MIQRLGGHVVNLSVMSITITNPLEIRPFSDSTDLNNHEEETEIHFLFQKIQRLKIFFKLIKKDMTTLENAILEQLLLKNYENKGINFETNLSLLKASDYPILSDLSNYLKRNRLCWKWFILNILSG